MSSFYKQVISLSLFMILIPIFFVPTLSTNKKENTIFQTATSTPAEPSFSVEIGTNGFVWPTPGYTRINSYFGRRSSPTKFASSFHLGIDIGAPPGSNIVAVSDAVVIHTGFQGSGGYSITLKANNLQFVYHHVDPHYIISVHQIVKRGQVIGKVGPKNVYGVPHNPYRDSAGKPTNGATTGPHLHFTIKKDGKAVNPLHYF